MGRSITAKSVSKILSLKPKTSEKGRNKHFKKQLEQAQNPTLEKPKLIVKRRTFPNQ